MDDAPKVFISYSWKSEDYKNIVLQLARRLRRSGVDVILDRWYLRPGHNLYDFMLSSIREADKVLILCEKDYVEKANANKGGVGTETLIITPDLFKNTQQEKFIPVFMESRRIVPDYLKGWMGVSFQKQSDEDYDELLKAIWGVPLVEIPELGPVPDFVKKRTSPKPSGQSVAASSEAREETHNAETTQTMTAIDYFNRAKAAYKDGKYKEAIADYSKAIELNPHFAVAYHNRGLIYHDHRNYKASLADFDKAIELIPDYESAYFNRAGSYFDLKLYEQAIADDSKAIALRPDNSFTFQNRGAAYSNLGLYQKALADYNKAIALKSDVPLFFRNRASTYRKLGKTDLAAADEANAAELEKQNK